MTKYVFVTGGVVSGLGKGITVASLGRLLKARGYKVITQKFDPYINRRPGQLNPYEHGETFVTDDGTEADLDLGHYERFIGETLTGNSSMTMGKIYWSVLNKECTNAYNGATIQVVPHVTNEIKDRVLQVGDAGDIVITEVGGIVGDFESLPILEALRQVAYDVGRENVVFVHVTLVPYLDYIGEMKTKPSQHSVKDLLNLGIQPDILLCRSDRPIPKEMREKLALFCNVEPSAVIQNAHAQSVYEVPLLLEKENFADILCGKLKLECGEPDLTEWRALVEKQKNPTGRVKVGLVGQYASLRDAYLSVAEALNHAGIHNGIQVDIEWIPANEISEAKLKNLDGIILAGGIGEELSPGKVKTVEFARANKIPFLGIGNGLQVALSVSEFTDGCGAKTCRLVPGSKVAMAYGTDTIDERFRSYCETVPANKDWLISEDGTVAELKDHPWFVCVQFHPEYKSRLTKASPLFVSFIQEIAKP